MDDHHMLKAIRLLYEGYFNTDQDAELFAPEFYQAVGEILAGKSLPDLKLTHLILSEIIPPYKERYIVYSPLHSAVNALRVEDTLTGEIIFNSVGKKTEELFIKGKIKRGSKFKQSVLEYLKKEKVI